MPPRRRAADPLFDLPAANTGPGPVYQGVCKQIRELVETEAIHAGTQAGWIAQARSLARAVDVASGHTGKPQASGMQLAALHNQLDALLCRLSGTPTDRDPFADFLDDLNSGGDESVSPSPAPHPEV